MVAVGFLMLCLASTVLVVTTLCFKVTRYYGMILFSMYIAFLLISILAETKRFQIFINGVITEL